MLSTLGTLSLLPAFSLSPWPSDFLVLISPPTHAKFYIISISTSASGRRRTGAIVSPGQTSLVIFCRIARSYGGATVC